MVTRTMPLRVSDQVTLDANGNGQVELKNSNYGTTWTVKLIGLRVEPRPSTLEPECSVFHDGLFLGGSMTASLDADSAITEIVQTGEAIQAVWTGGDPGKTAILSLGGEQEIIGG